MVLRTIQMSSDNDEKPRFTPEQAYAFLNIPAAIMEPEVDDALQTYVESGGTPESAIEALANGYKAHAQVCNIMCDWLASLGDEPHKAAGPTKKTRRGPKPKPNLKDEPKQEENSNDKPDDTLLSIKGPVDGKLDATNCVEETLANMITKVFDQSSADTIFLDGGIGIDWLSELIIHRRWRTFLYQLIEQHPQCMMLTFTVKLISEAGFQNEISGVNTAAHQLDIYSRVLLTALKAVLKEHNKGCRTEAYEKAMGDLVRVVCQGEHTYFYALALLKDVARAESGWGAASCEHIAEELRDALVGREYETTFIRAAMAQTQHDQMDSHVVQALLTMTSKGELNPADISIVYDQYIMPRPPPIEVLRDSMVEELLLDALFHWEGPKVVMDHRDKYIFLLAYAASVAENVNKNGHRTQIRLELDSCRNALCKAVSALESSEDLYVEMKGLLQAAKIPVVAAGILYYIKTLLLAESRIGDPPATVLFLLDQISSIQPTLRERAFDVCCDLYDKIAVESDAAEVIMERQRTVVDRLVHLLSVGEAIPVLEKISEMFRDGYIDASLVRYFAMEVLEIIAPPYSRDLSSLLLPLVADEEIFDKAVQERAPAAVEFLNYCRKT